MKRLLTITLATILPACASLPTIEAAAKPIVIAAVDAEAVRYGVPPTDTNAILQAGADAWGSYSASLAGNPPAIGASTPAVGQAIAAAIPAGTTQSQQTVLLMQAASALLAPSK